MYAAFLSKLSARSLTLIFARHGQICALGDVVMYLCPGRQFTFLSHKVPSPRAERLMASLRTRHFSA